MKFILCALLFVMASSFILPGNSKKRFTDFKKIVGTWRMQTSRGALYEQWQQESASSLSGRSFKVRGSDTAVLENVKLKLEGDDVFYVAIVSDQNNQQPVPFKLVWAENNTYTFENKEHDYPQRVIYNLLQSDS